MNWKQFTLGAVALVIVAILGIGTLLVVNNALSRPAAVSSQPQPINVTVVTTPDAPAAVKGADPAAAQPINITVSNSNTNTVSLSTWAQMVCGAQPSAAGCPTTTATPSASVTSTASQSPTATVSPTVTATAQAPVATATPAATTVTTSTTVITGDVNDPKSMFQLNGIATTVDPKTLDVAKGVFSNTLGLGSEAWIAEPGKLLVGADFPQSTIDAAKGAIERFNPVNQYVCQTLPDCYVNLPEGGFDLYSGNGMRINFPDGKVITLKAAPRTNWLVVIRGRNSDNLPDTDLNTQVRLDAYTAGHILFNRYPGLPAGGFVSEGQFKQMAVTSHSDGTNCGANGCSHLFVMMYDVNTGAVVILHQLGSDPFELVYRNW